MGEITKANQIGVEKNSRRDEIKEESYKTSWPIGPKNLMESLKNRMELGLFEILQSSIGLNGK